MLKLKSKLFASLLCLAFVPSFAQAANIDFNYQSVYLGSHVFNVKTSQPWASNLEKASNGKLSAHFFFDAGIVKANDVAHSLIAGTLDMASGGLAYTADITPIAANTAIAFASRDAIHATAIVNKLYEDNKEIRDELAKIGKVLNMWGGDRAAFFSTTGPIKSPADLKGKRVLVWSGKQVAQVKAWGGTPVQVVPSDTYLGLQRGMGEVFMGPLPVGVANKLMEVAKDITPVPALTLWIFTFMSWDLWNDLSADEQKIIVDTTKDWGIKTGADLVTATNADIETMKKNGCTFHTLSEAEIEAFRAIDKQVSVDYIRDDFKRYGVKKDANQWVNYIFDVASKL